MSIAATGSSLLQVAVSARDLRARGVDLRLGQRVVAEVLLVAGERAVVAVGGVAVVAESRMALTGGQRLELVVGSVDAGSVVLRAITAEPGPAAPTAGASPEARHGVADLLASVGLPTGGRASAAAQALVELGLPVSPETLAAVLERMPAGRDAVALRMARAAVALEALGLERTPDRAELADRAFAPDAGSTLARALDELSSALRALSSRGTAAGTEALASSSRPASVPVESLGAQARAVAEAASALGDPPLGLLRAAERALSALGAHGGAQRMAPLVRALSALSAAIALADGGTTDDVTSLAEQLSSRAAELERVAADPNAPAQAVRNVVRAMRSALEPWTAGQGVAPAAEVDLALGVAPLLDLAGGASDAERTSLLDSVGRILEAVAERVRSRLPDSPPDAERLLRAGIARAGSRLSDAGGPLPPGLRRLSAALAEIDAGLAAQAAGGEVLDAVLRALDAAGHALTSARGEAGSRDADLARTLVLRVASDALAGARSQAVAALATVRAAVEGAVEGALLPGSPEADRAVALLRAALPALASALLAAAEASEAGAGLRALAGSATAATAAGGGSVEPTPASLALLARALRALPPAEAAMLRERLAPALAAVGGQLEDAIARSAEQIARRLSGLVARPLAGSATEVARALESSASVQARSTENRLLDADPSRALVSDLRAPAARLSRDADRLVAVREAVSALPAGDLTGPLVRLADAARQVAGALQALHLANAAPAAREGAPLVAWVHVPLEVGGERRLAELKVLRDPRGGESAIDPGNATVAIRLDTSTLGLVVAVLRTSGEALSVSFLLDRPDFANAVAHEAHALEEGLARAGFASASVSTETRADVSEAFDGLGAGAPGATISLLA